MDDDQTILESLRQRRLAFERVCYRFSSGGMQAVNPFFRRTCPCCGYPTLEARAAFFQCGVCSWEDDGQDDHNAHEESAPNEVSLIEGRLTFAREKSLHRLWTGEPTPPERLQRVVDLEKAYTRLLECKGSQDFKAAVGYLREVEGWECYAEAEEVVFSVSEQESWNAIILNSFMKYAQCVQTVTVCRNGKLETMFVEDYLEMEGLTEIQKKLKEECKEKNKKV